MKHLPLYNKAFERILADFCQFIKVRAYSRGKNVMYPTCAREFLFFLESSQVADIMAVKPVDITAYHLYLQHRPNQRRSGGLSESMIRHHLFSVRLLFDFLMDNGVIDVSPVYFSKFSTVNFQPRQILTEDEIKMLYRATEDKREKALLSLAYGCGLRRSEIVNLNVAEILFHKGMLLVRDGKFGKNRVVPMSEKVLNDLKDYLIDQRFRYISKTEQSNLAFMLNNQGNRANGQFLAKMLFRIIEHTQNPIIQSKQITLHCLRHSIATHLMDRGAKLEFVQQFLGHSEIDSSALYAKRSKQRMKIVGQI